MLVRVLDTIVVLLTLGFALMTFDTVRQYGISLFASAGVAGVIFGLAAQPVLSNLIAGIELAMTQPIRLEDAVTVQNEYGWIEEITATYVVIRLWDLRRLIVPLNYFIQQPFYNWTRQAGANVGSVLLYLDYTAPIDRIRDKAVELVGQTEQLGGKLVNVQVTNTSVKPSSCASSSRQQVSATHPISVLNSAKNLSAFFNANIRRRCRGGATKSSNSRAANWTSRWTFANDVYRGTIASTAPSQLCCSMQWDTGQ